jgi:hypothetical protein
MMVTVFFTMMSQCQGLVTVAHWSVLRLPAGQSTGRPAARRVKPCW